MIKSWFRQAQ